MIPGKMPEVRLGGRTTIEFGIGGNERQVLALDLREPFHRPCRFLIRCLPPSNAWHQRRFTMAYCAVGCMPSQAALLCALTRSLGQHLNAVKRFEGRQVEGSTIGSREREIASTGWQPNRAEMLALRINDLDA